jgi:hypothetical protein
MKPVTYWTLCCLLSACGGGGGGDDTSSQGAGSDSNGAPQINPVAGTFEVPENTTAVTTIVASDPNDDNITLTLVGFRCGELHDQFRWRPWLSHGTGF